MAPQQNIRFGFNPGFAEVVFNSQISVASGS
jgi:hypothetical protein